MAQFSFEEAGSWSRGRDRSPTRTTIVLAATLALEQGIAETRAGRNMIAAHTFEDAVEAAARGAGIRCCASNQRIRYEDATWRPGISGVQALAHLREAAIVLDTAVAEGFGRRRTNSNCVLDSRSAR